MKMRYEVHSNYGGYLGEITKKELVDGLRFNLLEQGAVGEDIVFRNGLLAHFRIALKKAKKEEKDKTKVKCWDCGEDVKSDITYSRVYCDSCASKKAKAFAEKGEIYARLKKEIMLERALFLLDNQEKKTNISEYKEAIEVVKSYSEKNIEKFKSKEEMAVAIELVKNKIQTKVGAVVAGHEFDFMLPDMEVLLEVDGYLHEYSEIQDAKFDIKAVKELGAGWEVIRVPTKYIAKNISQLLVYIREAYDYQQKVRKENNGLLPDYYSNREKKYYKKVVKASK